MKQKLSINENPNVKVRKMCTSNIVPRVTCFDLRAALAASPLGTNVCIDFSTLIASLKFDSTGNDCTCDIAKYPIPTMEPTFDDQRIYADPILRVVTYRLKNFSNDVTVHDDESRTICTYGGIKHVDSLTVRILLREQPRRIQFEADCIEGTFTVTAFNADDKSSPSSPTIENVDRESIRQLYEVTRRFLKRRRKQVARRAPAPSHPMSRKKKRNSVNGKRLHHRQHGS